MLLRRLSKQVLARLGGAFQTGHSPETRRRGPQTHVIILDGTMSSLEPGRETHAGLTYRYLCEMGSQVSVFYEAGVQWAGWHHVADVITGRGINRQIRRAYGFLASRYRPGDRIVLMGYSRGAFAVRSLAGVIDRVGLLEARHANVRNIQTAYRHYQLAPDTASAKAFRTAFCHAHTPVEMVGVWDTVKALGLRLPVLWRLTEARHAFHNHRLGRSIRHGYHALALDETRTVFAPVMWEDRPDHPGHVEQVWFLGTHGDVGGQLGGFEAARPLANISLVWMLEKAGAHGVPLPGNWRARLFTDAQAPSVGTWRGWARIFLLRSRRVVGVNASERLHETVLAARPGLQARHWRDAPRSGALSDPGTSA